MKKFYSFLSTMLCTVMFATATNVMAEEAVFDFSAGVPTSVNGVTFTTASSWNDYFECLQITKNDHGVFTAPEGGLITAILLEQGYNNNGLAYLAYGEDADLYEFADDFSSATWIGTPANSVTIKPSGTALLLLKATVTFEKQTPDGIKSVDTTAATSGTYDLSGRRVANAQSGLYIVNGKKLYIK